MTEISAPIPAEADAPFKRLAGHGVALGLVAVATWLAVLTDQRLAIPNLSLVFVLPVVIAAAAYGWGPALTAVVGGLLAYNFFLIEPRFSLRVNDPANVWALILLGTVAALVSGLAARLRERTLTAEKDAERALALQSLARALGGATDRSSIAAAAAEALHRLFKVRSVVVTSEGEALSASDPGIADADLEAARWAIGANLPTRAGEHPSPETRFDFWPVVTPSRLPCAIGLALSEDEDRRPAGLDGLIETVAGHLSVALERDRSERQVQSLKLDVESQRLKTSLLAAVSHDLRTPLSTIVLTLQSLRAFPETHDAATREQLLGLAEGEASRLSGLVANLLDMGRLDADAVTVRRGPVDLADLIATAIQRARLGARLEVGAVQPVQVVVDASLSESALANVLENAGKYSGPDHPVHLSSEIEGDFAVIVVEDEGPGFPGPAAAFFESFRRGVEGDGRPPGVGLGLSIAKGFLEAQGGHITAANRDDGKGARVRLYLPRAGA